MRKRKRERDGATTRPAALLGALQGNGQSKAGQTLVTAVRNLSSGPLKQALQIGQALWTDEVLRGGMVEMAEGMVSDEECKRFFEGATADENEDEAVSREAARDCLEKYQAELNELQLPLIPVSEYRREREERAPDEPEGDAEGRSDGRPPELRERIRRWAPTILIGLLLFGFDAGYRLRTSRQATRQQDTRPWPVRFILAPGCRLAAFVVIGAAAVQLGELAFEHFWHPKKLAPWLGEHGLGFLLTAVAVSFGAPFWFDLLGRLVKLRASGSRPQPPAAGKPTQASPGAAAPGK